MTLVQRIYLKVIVVWVATLAALYVFQAYYTR
jgi:hypothetical protein